MMENKTISAGEIEALLAQTQCGECGYAGCAPYAAAIVSDGAALNLCRPGGARVIANLARALGREAELAHMGAEAVPAKPAKVQVAAIDGDRCIGCTLCIQACPTDAILGAPKQLHAVLAADCTGCGLCVPVCPADCIDFTAVGATPDSEKRAGEIAGLIAAKKARAAGAGGGEVAATLSGGIKDMDYGASLGVGLEVSPEMQAKMDAARAAATQKWTTKKTPATPKVLRDKK